MSLKIRRRQESTAVPNWREDANVVATRARIAELDAFIAEAHDRLSRHDVIVADEARALERAEVESLAGRATSAALAQAQGRHLDARRARAKEVIAVEDAQAERAKLAKALPGLERVAKQASYDVLRAKAAVLLREMRAALTQMAQSEGEYGALVLEAQGQFPYGMYDPKSPNYDPAFTQFAGLTYLSETRMNGRRQEVVDLEGATANFARDIDALLKSLGEPEAA